MTFARILLLIILVLHIFIAVVISIRIIKTPVLTTSQKRINIALTIIFPFIWSVLVYYILKKEPSSHETPLKNDLSSNGFHESGIAISQPPNLL